MNTQKVTRFPIAAGRVGGVYIVFTPAGIVVRNDDEDMAETRAYDMNHAAGYADGEAMAYFDGPSYAVGPQADLPGYAIGFEAGYDANWERADSLRRKFGCEESYIYE